MLIPSVRSAMEADLFGYEAYGSEGGEEEVVRIATPEERSETALAMQRMLPVTGSQIRFSTSAAFKPLRSSWLTHG